MERKLYTIEEVKNFIAKGCQMVLNADEEALKQLPKGNWIGGTTPYFMNTDKGVFSKDLIFVDDFTNVGVDFKIEEFDVGTMPQIANNSFKNGFTVLILPFEKEVYHEFAYHSLSYDGIFNNPVVGFVAGCDFDLLETAEAKVVNGLSNELSSDKAIALHVKLPGNKIARTEILNLDNIQPDSDTIVFPETSFTQSNCLINGKDTNIAEYLDEIGYIQKAPRPLIASTNGALINRDIKVINTEKKEVTFFSPVYEGDEYFLTDIITDYERLFNQRLEEIKQKSFYTSICVSYYLLGQLEGKKINTVGAFAFGEIAFQLLNKTLVLLEIDDV